MNPAIPVWLQYASAIGGCAGVLALLGGLLGVGRLLQVIDDVKEKVKGVPALQVDVAYIKGRLDGRQEGLDEVRPPPRPRRPKIAAV